MRKDEVFGRLYSTRGITEVSSVVESSLTVVGVVVVRNSAVSIRSKAGSSRPVTAITKMSKVYAQ